MTAESDSDAQIIVATRRWLERAVIGLQLCPFAEAPHRGGRVRFCVSRRTSSFELLEDLRRELEWLQAENPVRWETTLLIHPFVLTDFVQFNEFLGECAAAVAALDLEGELQIASFHPRYQFAGSRPQDIENYTNRSPYPMLHLLRESSVERAVQACPDTDAIYRRNISTLRKLGMEGWRRLWEAP